MHSKDFILHKESVLSSEDCNNIITFFEDNSHLHKEGQRCEDTEMFFKDYMIWSVKKDLL